VNLAVVKRQAADDAATVLARLGRREIPVDPVRVAREMGLIVVDAELGPDTMGLLVKEPGQDPTIMLNKDDGENRRRFTCAHEIGHYVRRSDEAEEYSTVDLRSGLSAQGSDEDEVYANGFAAALLMPEPEVTRLVKEGVAEWEMSLRFAVSREAMQYRLKNLESSAG